MVVRRLVDDPRQWLTAVYNRYHRNVLRYALQHADQGLAEDVASETLGRQRRLDQLPHQHPAPSAPLVRWPISARQANRTLK